MTLLPEGMKGRRERKDLKPEKVFTGAVWTEGPTWLSTEQKLLFSEVANSVMYLYDPATKTSSIFRPDSGHANGNTLDPVNIGYYGFYPPELKDYADYVIITCEHGRRCVSATLPPHAVERYIKAHGNKHSGEPPQKRVKGEIPTPEVSGVPEHMFITNKVIVDKFRGKRFNSPNDVVVHPKDGTIWFTDPPYGLVPNVSNMNGYLPSQINACHIYAVHPSNLCNIKKRRINGKDAPLPAKDVNFNTGNRVHDSYQMVERTVSDIIRPNGLAFSPDGTKLYVAECEIFDYDFKHGKSELRVYDVKRGGKKEHVEIHELDGGRVQEEITLEYTEYEVTNGRKLCDISPGIPDGFRLDADGFIYTSCGNGIIVIDPSNGKEINRIISPEVVSNCSFGGPDGHDLYITADTSVYVIHF